MIPQNRPPRFELCVLAEGESGYGLELLQAMPAPAGSGGAAAESVVRLTGTPLQVAISHVLQALRNNGYRPTDLDRSRTAPFLIKEEDGVRLGLLMLTLKPMSRIDRMEQIALSLRAMEPEEAYYWFSKSVSAQFGPRAQAALRILLTED